MRQVKLVVREQRERFSMAGRADRARIKPLACMRNVWRNGMFTASINRYVDWYVD